MIETAPDGNDRHPPLLGAGDIHLWQGRPAPERVTRQVLAPYVGGEQNKLSFVRGRLGKPELDGLPLRFSRATTRDRTLVAVASENAVGVDIEWVRPISGVIELTAKAFGADAAVSFGALPRGRRDRAFLQAWVRLEAAIKVTGRSLGLNAAGFRIAWSPDAEPKVLAISGDRQAASRIEIQDLSLGPHHVGAVAMFGRIKGVRHFAVDRLPTPDL